MDSVLKQMYFTYEYFRACFPEILVIVAYLNRKIGVKNCRIPFAAGKMRIKQ